MNTAEELMEPEQNEIKPVDVEAEEFVELAYQSKRLRVGWLAKVFVVGAAAMLGVGVLAFQGWLPFGWGEKLVRIDSGTNLKFKINQEALGFESELVGFGEFEYEQTEAKAAATGDRVGVSEILNLSAFEMEENRKFASRELARLKEDNLLLRVNRDKFYLDDPEATNDRLDDWAYLYDQIAGSSSKYSRQPQDSVYFSSDYVLHVFHKLLEKEFEVIEQKELFPRVKEISQKMTEAAHEKAQLATSEEDRQSLGRIAVFFGVAQALTEPIEIEGNEESGEYGQILGEDRKRDTKENVLAAWQEISKEFSSELRQQGETELGLILEQNQITTSPLFGALMTEAGLSQEHDYTQYTPRSRYTKNDISRAYFRAMMWFGRTPFLVKSQALTRDAIYISLLINETELLEAWEEIYQPTAFLVGQSDDLDIYDYLKAVADITGGDEVRVDEELVSAVSKATESMEGPKIMSSAMFGEKIFSMSKEELQAETKGFRFMGQRFTPDAFILSSLTQGDEAADPETGEKLPSMPTNLMVMSALGNERSEELLGEWILENAPESGEVLPLKLGVLKKEFDKVDQKQWTQNLYWGWLYAIKGLWSIEDKTGYPYFVTTPVWTDKTLLTSLGTWTELKHDTLLYAKQSYAELGGGGPEGELPPVPKGYVEPNLIFWDRLIGLVKMMDQGLHQRNLLDNEFRGRNQHLIEDLEFLRRIAKAQIENKEISEEEFETLRIKGKTLGWVLRPLPGEMFTEKDARSALIADIHTDVKSGKILYQANGIPNYIYVAVKDINGTRLTKGLVFNQFEFAAPIDTRLTDEDWQGFVYSDDNSKMPVQEEWKQAIIEE